MHFIYFLLSTFFIYFHTQHHNITSINKKNKKKNRHILNISKVQSKGRERGKDKKTQNKSFLYIILNVKENTAKHQRSKAWPHCLAPLHIHMTLFAGVCGSNVFLHMCGVNQFCIIVFFTAVKPGNNILFCIELIQRPESSLRRHKLGLTDQSIRSNDDKTRFACVHRLMTTGHSQNICRKVPDDAVLHTYGSSNLIVVSF